mmetsp:Transcript_51041/g.118611  ORF Transcript_51041/g.118611 Transcript_51041/m.118611 type:complete len:90 (-) Transcript_51041:449-718(-)
MSINAWFFFSMRKMASGWWDDPSGIPMGYHKTKLCVQHALHTSSYSRANDHVFCIGTLGSRLGGWNFGNVGLSASCDPCIEPQFGVPST